MAITMAITFSAATLFATTLVAEPNVAKSNVATSRAATCVSIEPFSKTFPTCFATNIATDVAIVYFAIAVQSKIAIAINVAT